jgi:hypothetical protein
LTNINKYGTLVVEKYKKWDFDKGWGKENEF